LVVEGASVHVESQSGSLDISTAYGAASDFAYHGVDLSNAPLSVSPGDTITVTASHNGMVSSRAWRVQGDGQQVDLGLVSGYQAPGPSAGRAWDAPGAAPADTGLELTVLTPEQAGLDSPDGAPAERPLAGAEPSGRTIHSPAPMGPASALTVCQGGGCDHATIQDAVDAAAEGDLIKVAEGTYTDVQARPRNDVATTGVVTQVVYLTKTVTIQGGYSTDFAEPPNAGPTILDAQGQGRVFYITGAIAPVIAGLEMTGGDAAGLGGGSSGDTGGGMLVMGATLTMSDCQVYSNTATFGGGIHLYESMNSTLSNNDIMVNSAGTQVGGVYIRNSPGTTLMGNDIKDNFAWHLGPGGKTYGGVRVVLSDDVSVIGNEITGNWAADQGGGLCFETSRNALVKDNYIADNSSGLPGFEQGRNAGGLLFITSDGAEVVNNWILNNRTYGNGAGVYVERSAITFINNVVADNELIEGAHPVGNGSGLWLAGDTFRLLHNTIAHNTGDDGTGIYVTDIFGYSGSAVLTNTIVVSHEVGLLVTEGNEATAEATLWGNGTDWGGDGTITVLPPNYWGDPGFEVQDGREYHLTERSMAINAGVDAGVEFDIDYDPRPLSWWYDLGADEYDGGPPPPQARFSGEPRSGAVPLSVAFEDQSQGLINTWNWDFGDGGLSGARHPAYMYVDEGTYTVSLTVSGPGGSDTEAKADYITAFLADGAPFCGINYVWPSTVVQSPMQTIYFNGNCYDRDADEGGAYIVTHRWYSSIDGLLSTAEDFSVRATALSAGTHQLSLEGQDDEGLWSPAATKTLTVATPIGVRTLILVNRKKLEDNHGAGPAGQVMDKLDQLKAHGRVEGLVVQVEEDAEVADAYATWDLDPTSTAAANGVAEAIKAVVDARWAVYPALEYLVVVGDDRIIPFRRVPDQVPDFRDREHSYNHVSPNSTVGAALADDMTLTDDYYGDAVPTVPDDDDWEGHDLYIPDLGIGRLIETPTEIIGQIDTFLSGGEIATGTAIVTGYDFLQDSAQAICDELGEDDLSVDCSLIGDDWRDDQFVAAVLNTRHDLVSINGHADHAFIGTPAINDDDVSSLDLVGSTADHARSLWYTPGCHSGLNVPPGNPYQSLDAAQALAAQQINYVANTGYGWGFRFSVGLSEQLMLDFSERLVYGQSATVGGALASAKQEYYLADLEFDYYDEKILIESTLYGLPMYRYTTPTAAAGSRTMAAADPAPIRQAQMVTLGDGLTVNSMTYQFPAPVPVSTDGGTYYTFGDTAHAHHAEPIQPKYVDDLSFPQTEARGIVFKGGRYGEETSYDPVVEQAAIETTELEEPGFTAPNWYPPLLHRLNRLDQGERLVTVLGQFNSQTETARLYEQLSFDIYYHDNSSDYLAPDITYVGSRLQAGIATATVTAVDPLGIETVVVAYTDGGGTWDSIALTKQGSSWTGGFPASADSEFFVQVVDRAGNVAVSDNDGQYFKPGDVVSSHTIFLPIVMRDH
jgi:parallel beta-helix repeat protein